MTTFERLVKCCETAGCEKVTGPEQNFKDDLGFDSLDCIEFTMAVEDEFGIEVPGEDIENTVHTVGEAIAYIEDRLAPDGN